MPKAAYVEFCKTHAAIQLPPREEDGPDFASDEFRVSWLKGGGLDGVKARPGE